MNVIMAFFDARIRNNHYVVTDGQCFLLLDIYGVYYTVLVYLSKLLGFFLLKLDCCRHLVDVACMYLYLSQLRLCLYCQINIIEY